MGDAIFSGRSSWVDVGQLNALGPRERIVVLTSDGREHAGKSAVIRGDLITLSNAERGETYRKTDIRGVRYVRTKPLTATQEHFVHENISYLDPELWWNGLFLGTIPVMLYDASEPEDNSPEDSSEVKCMNH